MNDELSVDEGSQGKPALAQNLRRRFRQGREANGEEEMNPCDHEGLHNTLIQVEISDGDLALIITEVTRQVNLAPWFRTLGFAIKQCLTTEPPTFNYFVMGAFVTFLLDRRLEISQELKGRLYLSVPPEIRRMVPYAKRLAKWNPKRG